MIDFWKWFEWPVKMQGELDIFLVNLSTNYLLSLHICRWIDKGQTWDICLVRLDGTRLAYHSQASLFCWDYVEGGGERRSRHSALRAVIRCLFIISIVKKGSDTALSWQKWAAHVGSVQMAKKIRNTKAFHSFQSKKESVKYFAGIHQYVLLLLQTSWHKP